MSSATYKSWHELPFREIWCVDFEFYPGRGLANGGREGDASTPLCLSALEMRSGRRIRLWQDELGTRPPYSIGSDSLVMGYMVSAELGCHIALGWPQPACVLDPYLEFRHFVNDGAVEPEDREKGFYGLGGALRYFCDDGIDSAHKKEMRDRIMQGPPFARQERRDAQEYCDNDTTSLARLVTHIIPTIRSLNHALFRGQFQWTIALQERRGIPTDSLQIERLEAGWQEIQCDLVAEKNAQYDVYEIENGRPHWRKERFAAYLRRNNMAWPVLDSGAYDERDQTFKDMEGRYPQVRELRQLRNTLSKLKLNDLQIGCDGRNRALLGAYGTKTGRNAPSNSKFIFGPAKWLRFLITPEYGSALVYRDFCQQEPRIAALLSGDTALLAACESSDVYLGMAKQLGLAPPDATDQSHPEVRALFKTVVLGILYGLAARSLALRTGLSLFEAAEILARLRARYRVFEEWARSVQDHAGLYMEIGTQFGWFLRCPPETNPRTIRNFPIQASGSEILHVTSMLAERRGVRIIAPVHDALMAEGDADCIEDVSAALDRCMKDASAIVLRGYELPTDEQIVRPGQRFFDKNGLGMWITIERLLAKLEAKRA